MASNCPNCDAIVSRAEMRDGWCESCGKRLPATAASKPEGTSRSTSVAVAPAKLTMGGFLIVMLFVTIGAVTATVARPQSSIATGLGCGIGAGIGAALAQAFGLMPRKK